jgi:arylsulfatase A-like enzyme
VYILNDDTDVLLGGAHTLRQTRNLLGGLGAEFTQFRTLSPKCTPSRTGQLIGRHYHNVRPAPTGPGLNQTTMFDVDALFPQLHAAGYLTSIVGKVHNDQGSWLCGGPHGKGDNTTFPFSHISTQCKPCGNYWGTEYVVMDIGEATTRIEAPALDPEAWSTYSHGQFGNRSVAFMKQAVAAGKPFFAHIGVTGPHLPSQPAPWHAETVRAWAASNVTAPRGPNFNFQAADGHPTLAAMPAIDHDKLFVVDQHFRDRLGVLLSIDDLVAEVGGWVVGGSAGADDADVGGGGMRLGWFYSCVSFANSSLLRLLLFSFLVILRMIFRCRWWQRWTIWAF